MYTARFTEMYQFGGQLYPADKSAGTHNTDWLDHSKFHRSVWVVIVGDMDNGATLDFKLQEATDDSGSDSQDINGKAITQLTQSGGDGNSVVVVELQTEEMDVTDQFRYVRGQLVVANAAVQCSVIPLRGPTRYAPVSTTVLAEVVD